MSRSFRCSAPCGLKPRRMISALAATTKTTPITASCTAARRRSLHSRKAAISNAAATALICTDQPCGSHPMASAATTPSPATWAIARSIKTMPRSSTSCPNGTWVASTSSPARKAGSRMLNSTPATGGPRQPGDEPGDRVVEQPDQVACLVRTADREGQSDCRRVDALGDEFRAARVFVSGIEHRAHAFGRPFGDKLRQVLAARGNPGLGLDCARLAQPEPIFEIGPALVIGADRGAADRRRLLRPPLHCRVPPAGEALRARGVYGGVRRIELRHARGERRGHRRNVARIGLDVRIAGGVDVALGAIETGRNVEQPHLLRGLEIAGAARLDPAVRGLPQ